MVRTRFRVRGTVQGVGFRPFVYRHATALGLGGFVRNDSDGVVIEVEGEREQIAVLARTIVEDPPPLALITALERADVAPVGVRSPFTIEPSRHDLVPGSAVSVDTATCDACLREVLDPSNRRFRHPFASCTDCGPRYTIVKAVPYDRAATTMAAFAMCPQCQAEYDDPADRRFHAQPNACPGCGPTLTWRDRDGRALAHRDEALRAAVAALAAGEIVAVKGLGGYHLAVDATNSAAVTELRRRKSRDDKPFAVMVPDVAVALSLCDLDADGLAALRSPMRPIVLGRSRGHGLVAGIAPGLPDLGLFLPYSALHHLLLDGVGRPLVMTSGNVSDEPIAYDDGDAVTRLGPMVDHLLTHDRPIHIRCDDSIVRATPRGVQTLRRSRGYAPEPMRLPVPARRPLLAVGAELKSTISVARGSTVVASHHLGDLEHLSTYGSFLQAIDHLTALYGVTPVAVAHDLHPEYLSTKLALETDLVPIPVQHHHAHVAACLVEHGRTEPVIGLAFDGLGYGTDGTLWGGELLVADLLSCERVGHLMPVALPGGAAAIREPWRMAASWARRAVGPGPALGWAAEIDDRAATVVDLAGSSTAPVTTSVGRLFDAVAAIIGCRPRVSYEAQTAVELEAMALTVPRRAATRYVGAVAIDRTGALPVLDPTPLVACLLTDVAAGIDRALLAAAFHESMGRAAADLAVDLAAAHSIDTAVLTGGVFQNVRLTDVVAQRLEGAGLRVLTHRRVPPNDGGISIGQAAVAAARDDH